MPATGKTPGGSSRSSLSFSTWLRTTLIGQQPSPSASAAVMNGLQHEARVDGGVHEHVERVVDERPPAQLEDPPHAAVIAAEDQEARGGGDERHVGDPAADRGLLGAVVHERRCATCCRSDFDGADSAAASAMFRTSSGTGAAV